MKHLLRFLIIISAVFIICFDGYGCAYDEFEDMPYAAFKIVEPIKTSSEHSTKSQDDETVNFWYGYTRGEVNKTDIRQFFNTADAADAINGGFNGYFPFIQWLEDNGKKEAVRYLINSVEYSSLRKRAIADYWDYEPGNDSEMRMLLSKITVNRSSDIYPRQLFLKSRVLHALRENKALISLWQNEAKKLPETPLKKRIEGYVGGAYYYAGNYISALEIFYRLCDRNSLSWCVSHLIGIDQLRELDSMVGDSPVVLYVLQDYVNYLRNLEQNEYQEKLYREKNPYEDNEYVPEVFFESASGEFLELCRKVLSRKGDKNEQAWRQAYSFVLNLTGDYPSSVAQFKIAESLPANDIEKQNLKRLSLCLAAKGMSRGDFESESYFVSALRELIEISDKEKKLMAENTDYDNPPSSDMTDFLGSFFIYYGVRTFEKAGRWEDAVILQKLLGGYGYLRKINREVPLADLVEFLDMLNGECHSDMLVKAYAPDFDRTQLIDVIATRKMRANRFEEARIYLEKVPVEWYASQSTYPYICGRHYQLSYFKRTQYKEKINPRPDGRHYKLDFCNRIINLQKKRENQSGAALAATDYELAGLLYQASPSGDLWVISDYSWTVGDCNEFNAMSLYYLKSAWTADTGALRGKIAYGLMKLPTVANKTAYGKTWDTDRYYFDAPTSSQLEGYQFIKDNWATMKNIPEVRTCDVIREYVTGHFVSNPYRY